MKRILISTLLVMFTVLLSYYIYSLNGGADARNGDREAQFNLALRYVAGEGVFKNEEKAVYWYAKSAQQNNTEAQYNLARCYENGKGVLKSYDKALSWYMKAAQNNNADSMYQLAVIHATQCNVVKAYAYVLHANLNGFDDDKLNEFINNLGLSNEQKLQGQKLAKSLFTN